MKKKQFIILSFCLCFGIYYNVQAQNLSWLHKGKMRTDTSGQAKKKADSLAKTAKIKPYKDVITQKAITRKGFITIDKVDTKLYFEIPDSLFGRDILIVNRISRAAIDNTPEYRENNQSMLGYAGDEVNKQVIRFERSPDNFIVIREVNYVYTPLAPNDPMYENVKRSSEQPIVYRFPIAAVSPDSNRVIEVSSWSMDASSPFGFSSAAQRQMHLGGVKSSLSYLKDFKAYPQNISVKQVLTFGGAEASGGGAFAALMPSISSPDNNEVTYEVNSSWMALPKVPMHTREFDHRVGYFCEYFADFGKNQQSSEIAQLIERWRLEPKPRDEQKYLAGELVEPAKPIVIYIDPTTPEKWVPYLMKGINDWQKAFEKAGFKNAIIAKRAPTAKEDSTWSIDDVRYSTLVYMPSTISNASGFHVGDPRTGEILETHIAWYHDVMKLLHSWYIVQCGATDPRARKAEFDDELMGELIRFVSSHEVGHALGLRHNFIASNATPVELLRNKEWVEAHGHTSSIMDYARFNYVAQPEDHIGPAGLYPRIGDYDEWAIEWGYKWFGNISENDETSKLRAMVFANADNPRLRFSPGVEEGQNDPRAQMEDLGDDDMKANTYGIKNLEYVAKNMPQWLDKKDGSGYEDLMKGYDCLITQYETFLIHAVAYIGGIYTDNKTAEEADKIFSPVPVQKQEEAIDFIDRFLFHEPKWLVNENLAGRLLRPEININSKINNIILDQLYDPKRLLRIMNSATRYGKLAYQPLAYMQNLQNRIWSELKTSQAIDLYRAQLQDAYLNKIISLLKPAVAAPVFGMSSGSVDLSTTEYPPICRSLLTDLNARIETALKTGKNTDKMTVVHLKTAKALIKNTLDYNY